MLNQATTDDARPPRPRLPPPDGDGTMPAHPDRGCVSEAFPVYLEPAKQGIYLGPEISP